LILVGGPVLLAVVGAMRGRPESTTASVADASAWDWTITANSALLYTLAFSLVFFVQELFLVLPKALTPGLRPTLFHNNHHWEGDNPLARLFQGTGALAVLILALAFTFWLKRRPPRSTTLRVFVIWMAFHGFFESLPQVVIGAIVPANDVGMAMEYLRLTPATKTTAAFVALTAIPAIAIWLSRSLLELAGDPGEIEEARQRTRFVFQIATWPALVALPLIVLFRVPGTLDQVVLFPVLVTAVGIPWIQASAWTSANARSQNAAPIRSIRQPLVAVAALFLLFQLVLRPGIPFF
jgi:hypothetical protein